MFVLNNVIVFVIFLAFQVNKHFYFKSFRTLLKFVVLFRFGFRRLGNFCICYSTRDFSNLSKTSN